MDWARRFLLPANTCAQVAAVVEKRLWPAHSCVSFNGAVLIPVLLSADAAGIFPSMSFVSRSFPSNHMFLSIRSSPLVWGKWSRFAGDGLAFRFITCVGSDFWTWSRHRRRRRFIPTCVGLMTDAQARSLIGSGSSPRAWGRWFARMGVPLEVGGSSPRAWGRLMNEEQAGRMPGADH